MKNLNAKQIDILNIAMMLASCVAAYVVPLELFLFSYAVLGPLHYLSEISWLHKRDYFAANRRDVMWLAAACLLLLPLRWWRLFAWMHVVVGAAFGIAVALIMTNKKIERVLIVGLSIGLAVWLKNWSMYKLFAAALVTVIHVYLFTGLFILYGALKSRSRSGYASCAVFVLCGAMFFVLTPQLLGVNPDAYLRANYLSVTNIGIYIARVFETLGFGEAGNPFTTQTGVAVLRFLAFAYTYHYLNWFSKTSIIKWHEVPRWALAVMTVLWLASVGIYFYDFRLGLFVLLFLSYAHVILEFPLNHKTAHGIVLELRARLTTRRVAAGI